jgi:cytochrome c biogenesis factor
MLIALTLLILACAATVMKLVDSVNKKSFRGTIISLAPHIVHLGLVFILIGFIGSNFFVTEEDITLTAGGPPQEVGEYEFEMTDSTFDSDSTFVTVEITKNGQYIGTGKPGAVVIGGQNRNEIHVTGTPTEDIYLVFYNGTTSPSLNSYSSVDMQVKVLPLMSVLWLGMWLMAAGMFMRLMAELARPRKKMGKEGVEKRAERRRTLRAERDETGEEEPEDEDIIEPEDRDDGYYDDLIERELEDM